MIINELSAALDVERGGSLAVELRELYDYMQRQLTKANIEQIDPPLAEVHALLNTLYEAWLRISPAELYHPQDFEDSAEIGHSYSC